MIQSIVESVLKPLTHRISSVLATSMASFGFASGEIEAVISALGIMAGIGVDLVVRRFLP